MYYRWTYSWQDILKFYKRKQTIYAERRKVDFSFLVDLATAALGGGKKDDEVGLLSEDDLDEISPEQDEALRKMLGSDYAHIMGQNNTQPQE